MSDRYAVGHLVPAIGRDGGRSERVEWLDELVAERFGVGPRVRPGVRVWEPTDSVGDLRRRLLRAAEGLSAMRRAHPDLARDIDRLEAAVWPDNRRQIAARRRALAEALDMTTDEGAGPGGNEVDRD